jgi:hypothetical protein
MFFKKKKNHDTKNLEGESKLKFPSLMKSKHLDADRLMIAHQSI